MSFKQFHFKSLSVPPQIVEFVVKSYIYVTVKRYIQISYLNSNTENISANNLQPPLFTLQL